MMHNNKLPLVSIISVNYNQSKVTLEMIASLKIISYPNIEIIVVDNASPNDTPEVIKEKYPDVKLIFSKKNLGFAGGNNLAVLQASGKYLLFLNNDTEVEPGFLEPLVEHLENNPETGMISPKIIFWYSPDKKTIQYAGSNGINPYSMRGSKIGYNQTDTGQFSETYTTELAHGAAMMVPADIAKKVGLMSDIYFLYYEEHDWCERIKKAGYKVVYAGDSIIYHKESISVGKNTPMKTYYLNRGRLLFMRRNLNGIQWLASLLFFIFLAFPKNIFTFFISRKFIHLKAFWSAVLWNLTNANIKRNPEISKDENMKIILINDTEQTIKTFT